MCLCNPLKFQIQLALILDKMGNKKGTVSHYKRVVEIAPPSYKVFVKRVKERIRELEGY